MIEARGLVAAGRTEREVEQDIYAFALAEFGVEKHWHKRIVRAGANGLATARDNPPVLTIADDDLVYLDLGPVFEEWEADVGRSYVVGDDPDKHRLVADLSTQFDAVKARFDSDPDVTGADLYAFACDNAAAAGWRFGGVIAGHIVGEFPHAHLPGEKDFYRINPENPGRLRDPDPLGQERFWILEIHLVDPAGRYGGFYERLMS
ncbi:aminopeptidase P family protein [Sphingomonas panacisoli]|uniref:Aminopeptidase P family protein n=2 Tax=Sphingomonas panacisoli TaxID=1813879 RepID=A0A5B8LNJ5_9SPHN|nr:aminopeptidase P family protein [Sphingomonas panacisoli]